MTDNPSLWAGLCDLKRCLDDQGRPPRDRCTDASAMVDSLLNMVKSAVQQARAEEAQATLFRSLKRANIGVTPTPPARNGPLGRHTFGGNR